MSRYKAIYENHAMEYHRMIAVEDTDGNLLPAMQRVTPLRDKRILDVGSGTGRIPILLKDESKNIIGFELQRAMLQEQRRQRGYVGGNWGLAQGDMRALPFLAQSMEVVVAGWSIGHFCSWFEMGWKVQIGRVLDEMHRIVVPGGALIILETMTTGSLTPAPPTTKLAQYYEWLEEHWGFHKEIIQTDYQFRHVAQAIEYTEFFFGPELAEKIKEYQWSRLPEWTGVWGKKL
ncbi:MAG: class I SAM-dependent methyltransferase [Anaerolineae bacterium]|nr:class I SAM-dependent methyltransferase [Anaerolineae bacterium]